MNLSSYTKYEKYEPFLKRVGNRDLLMTYLLDLMPAEFNNYCEPFVGDGAVLFALHPDHAIINDANYQLINAYQMVQKQPKLLSDLVSQYLSHNSKSFFNQLRNVDRHRYFQKWTNLKQAARFIYLNQVSLSGKWTTNWWGHCNMAYNSKSNISINEQMIINDSQYLNQHVQIQAGYYQEALHHLKAGDLVYLNPPYVPISAPILLKSKIFGDFDMNDQRELAEIAKDLVSRGIYVMMSNADVPLLKSLYPKDIFTIHSIPSLPMIDANDNLLKDVNEAIIVSNNF